jgi:flagellar basal-body rod modification protein FlgD
LITEMQNQDPTEPMKSSDYVAQFATFSTVEQIIQTNAKLDAMLTASALSQADALLGHTVTSGDGQVSGVVQSLKLTGDGLVASLDGGQELLIGEGVTIS